MEMEEDSSIPQIACCICGTGIQPNQANMCPKCLNTQVDVSEGIARNITMFQCRGCQRYLRNLKWFDADLETPELLAICLKKIQGLNRVNLVDAVWIWTEPHSKRLKIRLTIQKEVFNNTILEKRFIVDFVVKNQQCDGCAASYTEHTWKACVQARQKVKHKKTFLYLEQLILKHNLAANCMGIKYQPNGLDFFFESRSKASHFADFFRGSVPCRTKDSKRLVTHDPKSNDYKYKHSYFIEICPICKFDLVILPPALCRSLGGHFPILLCDKVSSMLHCMDVNTLKILSLDADTFFRRGFRSAATYPQTKLYMVMEVNPVLDDKKRPVRRGKYQLCDLELVAEDDEMMTNVIDCRSHLGNILKEGDYVKGYDLTSIQTTVDTSHLTKLKVPDVLVVKKIYKNRRRRKWKLKTMASHMDLGNKDKEEFMRDLEEDAEMRAAINVYKDDDLSSMSEHTLEDVAPQVPLAEMLAGFRISEDLPTMDGFEEDI